MHSVAIIITVFRNPPRLAALLDNMSWAGIPDIPIYVYEDTSPEPDAKELHKAYANVCKNWGIIHRWTPEWSCMHGVIEHAMRDTKEDWIIYIPDDVMFTRGSLWNEYAGVLAYGRDFVGGIQAPFWTAMELQDMEILSSRSLMFNGWVPENVPRNPHWDYPGLPRKYINLNGAGFSLNRQLFRAMGGWPRQSWRLDEWAGYQAWTNGMVCITLPGPPRIHWHGGSTHLMPEEHPDFSSVQAWVEATGKTPSECGNEVSLIMDKIPDGNWPGILKFFQEGGKLV